MVFFLSKIRTLLIMTLLFNISLSEFQNKNNLIFSPLFSQENFGRVHKIFYQNDKKDSNLILLSEDSISSVNLPKKEVNYRKTVNKLSEIVSLEQKNFFVTQRQSNTVEVFRTETGQFVNSLEIISNNDFLYKVQTVKIKEFTMTIFLSFKSLIMQSKKKIIFEKNFQKEDAQGTKNINMIFDLHVDEENQFITYGLTVNGIIKVNKMSFDSIHKTIISKTKIEEEEEDEDNEDVEEKKEKKKKKVENVEVEEKEIFSKASQTRIIKGLLTKDFLYIYDGRNVFGYNVGTQAMEMFGIPEQYITLNVWSYYKENGLIIKGRKNFYYFYNGQISFQFETINHIACSMSNLPLTRLYCYLEDNNSDKNLVAYFPKNDGLDRQFYTIDSLVKIYSDSNTLDRVKLIEVSPYNDKIFTLVTTNKIKEFMINSAKKVELIGEMDNNYDKYVLSEIFIYHKKDESNNNDIFDSYVEYQNYYTTINSLKGNINLLKILKNLSKLILDDVAEIGRTLHKLGTNVIHSVNSMINKRAFDLGKETTNKENIVFLFLVTENNLMKVLDAYTGKVLYIQQFPRNQKLRILKDNSSTNQRYVSILLGKKNFFVYDLQENNFVNDIGSVMNKLNLDDEFLINEEQLSIIMKSFLSLVKDKPIYDLRKYKLDEKLFGPKKEKIALYVDYEQSILYLLKFYINKKNEQKLILLHSINFGKILSISNPKITEDVSQHYLSEGKIFYKFINNNIYYILSSEQKENIKDEKNSKRIKERLILTILDGRNGKILSERAIENLEISSVRYLFEENWGIISYTKINKGFKRNEIFSFEIMKKNIDYSLSKLFKNNILSSKKPKENENEEIEIIIKTYVMEREIKSLSVSKSKYHKGNKFVLMILDNNDLQLVKRDDLSPRRPNMVMIKGKPTFDPETNSIYTDKELPFYTPIVKLDLNNRFVNKDKIKVFHAKTAEGENESSFITCIVGENIDCKIMYPDKLYDTLSPEFKKELLIALTLGFVVFIYFFRKYYVKNEFSKVLFAEK